MAFKTPQEYSDELMRLYRENALKIAETDLQTVKSTLENENSEFADGTGGLQVAVTTFQRLYPVKSATVTVFTGTPDDKSVIDVSITDQNGKSKTFVLDTKPKSQSQQSENGDSSPFNNYNVSVTADGYIETLIMNIPVFSQTVSFQEVDLLTVSAAANHKNPQIINDGNHYDL